MRPCTFWHMSGVASRSWSKVGDIFQRKSRRLRRPDEAQALQGFLPIEAIIPSRPPVGLEEADPLVIAYGRGRNPYCSGQLANGIGHIHNIAPKGFLTQGITGSSRRGLFLALSAPHPRPLPAGEGAQARGTFGPSSRFHRTACMIRWTPAAGPSGWAKMAVPATSTLAPAWTARGAVRASTPPSTSRSQPT